MMPLAVAVDPVNATLSTSPCYFVFWADLLGKALEKVGDYEALQEHVHFFSIMNPENTMLDMM
jgi:hypothetical protein